MYPLYSRILPLSFMIRCLVRSNPAAHLVCNQRLSSKVHVEASQRNDAIKQPPPEPPSVCCESGCPNCVWIQYADELIQYCGDKSEAQKKVMSQIKDPQVRAFVQMEINMLWCYPAWWKQCVMFCLDTQSLRICFLCLPLLSSVLMWSVTLHHII